MSRFFDAIPYILAVGAIVLGFLQIIKEWEEYEKKRWLRITVLIVLIIVGALTIVSLRLDEKSRQAEKVKAEGDIRDLKGKVDEASKSQKDNTGLFLESLRKMSNEVDDLKTEVKTEALQKKLATVQEELQKTQKAMAPGPKAKLSFSFVPFKNPSIDSHEQPEPVIEKTLPLNVDGSVHVEFTILNFTQAEATNVDVNIQICDACKYAKEPEGTMKEPAFANPETTRLLNVPRIEPMQFWRTISLDIIPPPLASTFTFGFQYRCPTCVLFKEGNMGTVHILGR